MMAQACLHPRMGLWVLLRYGLGRADAHNQWVFDRCCEVQADPDGYLDLWAREHYKMLRLDEPVATPSGWTAHGRLEPGDEVFAPDGSVVKVLARTEVFRDGPAFEIKFDDGSTMKAGADHAWPVERKSRKRIPGAYNQAGPKRIGRETVKLTTVEIAAWDHRAGNRLAIAVAAPLALPDACLPVAPYLLGAWLGDGTSANGDITCGDPELFGFLVEDGEALGHDKSPHRAAAVCRIDGLHVCLKALGLTNNKHIPPAYLRASTGQRLRLLQGLMDTDGHCNDRGTATFVNTNERLVDGVLELAQSLGLKPAKRRHEGTYNDAPYAYWQVSFQAYAGLCPFRLPRKAVRCKGGSRNARRFIVACRPIEPEPMSCIQVEGGLYLAGRELIPTHNSTIITFAKTIQDILANPEITVGIFSHTRPIAKAFLRQIKQEFERNERLKAWFPDILWADPAKQSPKWSEDEGITVKRKGNPKEATVEAWGVVDGQPTSKHFDLIVYDDIVVESSIGTPEMIKKTTDALANSYNLGKRGGTRRFIGTRYHYNDTYREIMERGTAKARLYPATVDGSVDGEPVFLSRPELADKRRDMGPYVFGCFAAGTPVLMSDWTEKPIERLEVGDEVVGYTFGKGQSSKLVRSKVVATQVRPMPVVRFTFESGRTLVCTEDHKFWHGRAGRDYAPLGLGKGKLNGACSVYDPATAGVPIDPETRGYLAGMFDGEGAVSGNTFHFHQGWDKNRPICLKLEAALDAAGFQFSVHSRNSRMRDGSAGQEVRDYFLTGGRNERIRFARMMFGYGKGARVAASIYEYGSRFLGHRSARDKLLSVEHLGEANVFNIQTETGNYVAGGYAVKNCQMLQDPTADDKQGFKLEWLRYAAVTTRGQNLVMLVDPASKKRPTSDYTSMWLIGLGPDRKVYVHDMLRDRLSLTERADMLIKWHRYWSGKGSILAVAYEEYGLQADIEHAASRMEDENYRFDITPVGGRLNKIDRIRRLIPWFEQGRVYLPPSMVKTNYEGKSVDLVQAFKNEEYLAFPVSAHDDMLDALARFLDDDLPIAFPAPLPEEEDERDLVTAGRNKTTGY